MRVSEIAANLDTLYHMVDTWAYWLDEPRRKTASHYQERARRLYLHWWANALRAGAFECGYQAGHLDGWADAENELGITY